jgi:hypothetical protein
MNLSAIHPDIAHEYRESTYFRAFSIVIVPYMTILGVVVTHKISDPFMTSNQDICGGFRVVTTPLVLILPL